MNNDNMENKKIEGDDIMKTVVVNIERPCTIQKSIIESCKEVKLTRQGKLPKRSWKEFSKEMKEEIQRNEF